MLSAADVSNIEAGAKIAAGLNWTALGGAFQQQRLADLAEITVEDALTVAAPWLPQAGVAKFILHLAYSMVFSVAGGVSSTRTFRLDDLLKGLAAADGVDWRGFLAALKGDNAIIVAADTAEIVAKLAAPFFPPAAIAGGVFGALAEVGKFTHPTNAERVPGYHWDVWRGWIRN